MDTKYPAATFTATRDELLGTAPLLGSAEIARGVCRGAHRTVSVLAVTSEHMRRVDGWLGRVGVVTHAAAPDDHRALLGSVCDPGLVPELIPRIVGSLVGSMPDVPAPAPVGPIVVTELSPASLPDSVDWVVVVSTSSMDGHGGPSRWVVAAAGGLVAADLVDVPAPIVLEPIGRKAVVEHLAAFVGVPSKSVRDLLVAD